MALATPTSRRSVCSSLNVVARTPLPSKPPSNFVPTHGVTVLSDPAALGTSRADTVRNVPKSITSCDDVAVGSPAAALTVAIPPTLVVPGAAAVTVTTALVTMDPGGMPSGTTTWALDCWTAPSEIGGR